MISKPKIQKSKDIYKRNIVSYLKRQKRGRGIEEKRMKED